MMTGPSAAAPRWQARVLALRDFVERFSPALIQLMARLSIAGVFWSAGMSKIASWQSTIMLFRQEYKVPVLPPEVAATLAASVELSMPVLLVLGLFSRLATLPMLGMTIVIQTFVYPEDWLEHLGWATFLLLILTRGPGPIALDRFIAKWLER